MLTKTAGHGDSWELRLGQSSTDCSEAFWKRSINTTIIYRVHLYITVQHNTYTLQDFSTNISSIIDLICVCVCVSFWANHCAYLASSTLSALWRHSNGIGREDSFSHSVPGHSTHNYTLLIHTHTITYAAQPRGIHKHMTTVNKNWSQIISNIYSSKALGFWCTTSFPKSIPTRVSGWAVTAPCGFETALDEGRKRKNELYVKHGWGDQAADKLHLNWLTNTWRTKYELQQRERGGERRLHAASWWKVLHQTLTDLLIQ